MFSDLKTLRVSRGGVLLSNWMASMSPSPLLLAEVLPVLLRLALPVLLSELPLSLCVGFGS